MKNNKVYAILKNSYEIDDIEYGDLYPYYFSLNKETIIKEFNRIKKENIEHLDRIIELKKDYLEKYPDKKEDYQVMEDNAEVFKYCMGNWTYVYAIEEFDLY